MNEIYDYKTADTRDLIADLLKLGCEGWEVIEPNVPADPQCWGGITVRRPIFSAYTCTWRYHLFDTAIVPDEWWDHIRSCGWIILNPPYRVNWYGGGKHPIQRLHLAKRPDSWHTDDGDIMECLEHAGLPWVHRESETLSEILKIKWELSTQYGRDIGSDIATRYWLTHRYLPNIIGYAWERLAGAEDVANTFKKLEDLLSFREKIAKTERAWLDKELIYRWIQHMNRVCCIDGGRTESGSLRSRD